MATIKDVAKEAGVSITTVSRVMNKRGYISDGTNEKVLNAIKKLDYHPNFRAKAFSSKRTNIIGLILPNCAHPFFGEMIMYIEKYAFERGYTVMLCNSINDSDKERYFIRMLQEKRVDGLIMGSHNLDTQDYAMVKNPIITFERYINNQIPYVTCDNYTGGILATQHLVDKGCKHLLFISGNLKLEIYANQRLNAFKHICEQAEVTYEVVSRENRNMNYTNEYKFVEEELGHKLEEFDGVFCSSDMIALAMSHYCDQVGISVPKNLKIIGFDNNTMTKSTQRNKLTTIAQPVDKICKALVINLIKCIEGDEDIINVQLGVELVEGDTT